MGYKFDVFISYSRKDYIDENHNVIPGNAVSKIKDCLKKANISYWFDTEDIKNSDEFAEKIENNLEQSRMLLFISSKNSNASKWTRKEISLANDNNIKILPLKIDDAKFGSGIGFILAGVNFQEYYINPALALEMLVNDILKIKRSISEEEAKLNIIETAKTAYGAIQKQMFILQKIYKRLLDVGISEKICPVCSLPSPIEQRYCECCGFFFPLMYGISSESDIDKTYLSIMKGLWSSAPAASSLIESKKTAELTLFQETMLSSASGPYVKPIKEKGVYCVNGAKFKMIPVSGGSFTMGDDGHAHKVTISGFKIGESPVTQALWSAVMGDNPSRFKGENRPVEQVSWNDCQKFIKKLNEMTGKEFRLPTEAEWEFAARGGSRSINTRFSGSDNLEEIGWYNLNCSENEDSDLNYGTHDVKSKSPNELRIYDMSGNVWEWCNDWYADISVQPESNPIGPRTGISKVCRGGSWKSDSMSCKVNFRNYGGLFKRDCSYGLRLAL